jgi:DNA-binding helix-hairpin-helix protein with protein kinase domain
MKNIVGFYMPKAFPKSRDLYILSFYTKGKTIADRFKKYPDWFDKYERNTGEGILNRLKMMANISQAFYQIHKPDTYVVLDVKPMNILATSTGKISIVDTDSFQIAKGEQILFPGAAATPEYCAPEFDEQYEQGRSFTESNDLFSLSVMYYQFLVGTHPFTGAKLLPPYDTDEYSELKPVIHRSLFLYGCNKRYLEVLNPNPHAFFERMPRSLQLMFIKAFDAPNYRPTMEDWCKELFNIITK